MNRYDYIIIGGGIIGLSIARELKTRLPEATICMLEKESDVAHHASGRNSGVLHAGFYYSANSLKAKFTKEGNAEMTAYCLDNGLQINKSGKLVVAQNKAELQGLRELKRRANLNGVELVWVNEQEMKSIDPIAKSHDMALFSPTTSTVDPIEVCQTIKAEVLAKGVEIRCHTEYKKTSNHHVITNNGIFTCHYVINAAGLYADKIAKDYNFGTRYTIIPFKGIYLKYEKNKTAVQTNIYPVPNLTQPFLGVHFTKTVDGSIKIGPTAIPAFWRENYRGLKNFKLLELCSILFYETRLFLGNSFHFRSLVFEEISKYVRTKFIKKSMSLVNQLDKNGFGSFMEPGIRAQLLDRKTLELVDDFVVVGDHHSVHVLNAVSPGFTCAFPFSRYVVNKIIEKQSVASGGIKEQVS